MPPDGALFQSSGAPLMHQIGASIHVFRCMYATAGSLLAYSDTDELSHKPLQRIRSVLRNDQQVTKLAPISTPAERS